MERPHVRSVAKSLVAGAARLGFRGTERNTLGADAMKPFHPLSCSANNGVSFRLFQLFPAEKPGGFPSPESGTGCMGSSTALSEQPPRGSDRRYRALRSPDGRPGGTHSQGPRSVPLRHLGHPRIEYGAGSGRGAPIAPARSSRLPNFPGDFRSLRPASGSLSIAGSGNGDTVH